MKETIKSCVDWGAWVAQSVKHPTSAQVMISWFCGLELHIWLCADSSKHRACFGFCLPLSLPLPCLFSLSPLIISSRGEKCCVNYWAENVEKRVLAAYLVQHPLYVLPSPQPLSPLLKTRILESTEFSSLGRGCPLSGKGWRKTGGEANLCMFV